MIEPNNLRKNTYILNNPDNLLGDILAGGADPADGQEHVVLKEVPGQHLDLLGEGGGEHKGLSLIWAWHVVLKILKCKVF